MDLISEEKMIQHKRKANQMEELNWSVPESDKLK